MRTKVKTFFLEITEEQFLPKEGFRQRIDVREIENDAYLNFIFFAGVGLPWNWYSRLGWSITQWEDYFSTGRVKTYLGFEQKKLVGYYELENTNEKEVEIKFFGLFPGYTGRGLGGMLLSHAVESALEQNAQRVWLHTCTSDSRHALGNYLSRGFSIFREAEETEDIPGNDEIMTLISAFFNRYTERFKK